MNRRLLTVKEAAAFVGCHAATIRALVRAGKLRSLSGTSNVFLFDARKITSLPKIKKGRPRKDGKR